jgi:hypothetical protein
MGEGEGMAFELAIQISKAGTAALSGFPSNAVCAHLIKSGDQMAICGIIIVPLEFYAVHHWL